MKFAFVSLSGGALDYEQASALGGSVRTIIPLVEMLTQDGHRVYWYSNRPSTHYTPGDQTKVHTCYSHIRRIKDIFREAPQNRTFPGDDNISKTRYRCAWTVHHATKKVSFPDIDSAWINFMDVGPENIACVSTIALTFLKQGVPVFLFDTDMRFRYRSDYGLTGGSTSKYRFSYERFLSPKQADVLQDIVILHQCRNVPPSKYFSNLETFLPIYDRRRELLIRKSPKRLVTYIGNDYMRRPWMMKWYALGASGPHTYIYGDWLKKAPEWTSEYLEPYAMHIGDQVPAAKTEKFYNRSVATIHIAPPHYALVGHITSRTREATAAGCAIVTPDEMRDAREFTWRPNMVASPAEARERIRLLSTDYEMRESSVINQRRKLEADSGLEVAYDKFFSLVKKYNR